MENNSLQIKDYINIGLFTALYFAAMFITGAVVKIIPVLILFMPAFIGIVCGTIYMLFVTKVKKKGMIISMAFLIGILMSMISGIWTILATSVLMGLLAEFLSAVGKYAKFNCLIAGYALFNCWTMGAMVTIWLYRDWFLDKMKAAGGITYAKMFETITLDWVLPVVIAVALLGGLLGGMIGKKVLHKHFMKAGIV